MVEGFFEDGFEPIKSLKISNFADANIMFASVISGKTPVDNLEPDALLLVLEHFMQMRGFETSKFYRDIETNAYCALGFNQSTEMKSLHYLQAHRNFSLSDIKRIRHHMEKAVIGIDSIQYCGRSVLPPAWLISRLLWIGVERIEGRLVERWVKADRTEHQKLFSEYLNTMIRVGTVGLEKTEFGTTIIPPEFKLRDWAHFAERLNIGEAGRTILKGTNYLPFELMKEFRKEPSLLYKISPRDFEIFVAELLVRLQFKDVELTSRSADGGKDVIATSIVEGIPLKFFFECKRFGPGHKVGVPQLRALLGAVSEHPSQANIGVLTTTSTFTKNGVELIASDARLDGKDHSDLLAWLKKSGA